MWQFTFSKIVSAIAFVDLFAAVFALGAWGLTEPQDVSSTLFWCGTYTLAILPLLVILIHTLRVIRYIRELRPLAASSELTVKP